MILIRVTEMSTTKQPFQIERDSETSAMEFLGYLYGHFRHISITKYTIDQEVVFTATNDVTEDYYLLKKD